MGLYILKNLLQARKYEPDPQKNSIRLKIMNSGFHLKYANEISDYLRSQLSDGPNVQVYRFTTTPEEDERIRQNIDQRGGAQPGRCAVATSGVLSGVGPFENLGTNVTPRGLGSNLKGLPRTQGTKGPSLVRVSSTPYGPPSMKTETYGPPRPR